MAGREFFTRNTAALDAAWRCMNLHLIEVGKIESLILGVSTVILKQELPDQLGRKRRRPFRQASSKDEESWKGHVIQDIIITKLINRLFASDAVQKRLGGVAAVRIVSHHRQEFTKKLSRLRILFTRQGAVHDDRVREDEIQLLLKVWIV